jgi:hypothetical protein
MRYGALLLGLAVLLPLGAQTVRVAPSPVPDVQVMGAADPGFRALLDRLLPNRGPLTNQWIPYSVIVTNHTDHTLIDVAVSWRVSSPARQDREHVVSGLIMHPDRRIGPGMSAIEFPVGTILGPYEFTDHQNSSVDVGEYRGAASVVISLDGVAFDSGQFMGPDATHEFERLQAEVRRRGWPGLIIHR